DQEGGVVGDDLGDGGAAVPAVLGRGGVEDAHLGAALLPLLGEGAVRQRGAADPRGGPLLEFLGGDVAVVEPEEALGALGSAGGVDPLGRGGAVRGALAPLGPLRD